MTNKTLFANTSNKPNTVNNAGGVAYEMTDRHALAQLAATNCFNGTFYVSAEKNLEIAKELAMKLKNDPEFIAKVALYSRDKAYMKDMPAFLTVLLLDLDLKLFHKVFDQVIDNGKMLRNFCLMARSGAVTQKVRNLSSGACRTAIQRWFNNRSPEALFKASIGSNPTMSDILKMARPKPNSPEKEALYGYFLGKEVSFDKLPEIVREYENFKKNKSGNVPKVDFRLLDSLGLSDDQWTQIAENAPWQMTRMNLNTFERHGVFKNSVVTNLVAQRLSDREQIVKARQFPYQMMSAYFATMNSDVPFVIQNALQDAMEVSVDNVPEIKGNVVVCVDASGSMDSPITGYRAGGTTSVTCVQVAGLIASSILRKNPSAEIYTFNSQAVRVKLNPRDTVLTNTKLLANAGGGTNCSAALRTLNEQNKSADLIVYVSDMESWLDSGSYFSYSTGMLDEWKTFSKRNPSCKLACIDLTPNKTSQVKEHKNVLQVGGFSDTVFDVLAKFAEFGNSPNHWVDEIRKIEI